MGLDMYLTKRTYNATEAGYWRKANHIHNWMVENIQNGEDDCNSYLFPREKIKELLTICKEVMANPEKAEELLPTVTGFFFGDTQYGEAYFQDVKDTIDMLENILRDSENIDEYEYFYQSSW